MMRRVLLVVGAISVFLVVACVGMASTGGKNGPIVYAQELSPEHYQLFIAQPDGTKPKQITHRLSSVSPDWSPDGKRIVFGLEGSSSASIATMAADGSDIRNLTPKGFQTQPAYSPDGKWIVYERDIGPTDNGVWIMRADGSDKQRLTRNPFMKTGDCGCDTDPNFSPDGKRITFVRVKQDETQQALFSMMRDGSGLRQLTPYSWEVAVKHDWAPDGKLIVLTTNADFVRPNEAANLVTIHPDGTGKKQLTQFKAGKMNAFAGSFSPDGKQIVFRLETGASYSLAFIDRDGGKVRTAKTGKAKPRFIDWGTQP
jgi:Tol biopolymer transport system component